MSDQDTPATTQTPEEIVAATLKALNTGVVAAQREKDAEIEAKAREKVVKKVKAANKKLEIYTNPEIRILQDCKIAGHTVYAGDEVGANAGITTRDFKALKDLNMAESI